MGTAQPTYEDILCFFQETDRQLKELGKQIGELGSKFGSFTEGLALRPSPKLGEGRRVRVGS